MTTRVMVTGGAGFIGSHLVDALAAQYEVVVYDDLSTGSLENLEEAQRRGVRFIKGTVSDISSLVSAMKGVECVYHLAALPSVQRSIELPRLTHEVNVTGTLNILVAAKESKVKKVVFASTCAVYGDSPNPIKREESPLMPDTPYAVSKLAGELYCKVFAQLYNLQTVCLRYFNVYGPRQSMNSEYSAAIPRFIDRILHERPVVIYGDGMQTRDFVFVADVVQANLLAAKDGVTGVYNVGRGIRVTIKDVAAYIIKAMGNNLLPLHQAAREGDILHSCASLERVKLIGYEPRHNIEEAIRCQIF